MSRGVGRRCGSDLVLLWLLHRPAATAPIRPLAWELPYAVGSPIKTKDKKKKKNNELINCKQPGMGFIAENHTTNLEVRIEKEKNKEQDDKY